MVIPLSKNNHRDVVEVAQQPVIIDVYATWCGPCMHMKPIFEEVAKEQGNKYVFAELNVDESRELAISYGITSVPTFLFIKDNRVLGKRTGSMSKEDLLETITEYFE